MKMGYLELPTPTWVETFVIVFVLAAIAIGIHNVKAWSDCHSHHGTYAHAVDWDGFVCLDEDS